MYSVFLLVIEGVPVRRSFTVSVLNLGLERLRWQTWSETESSTPIYLPSLWCHSTVLTVVVYLPPLCSPVHLLVSTHSVSDSLRSFPVSSVYYTRPDTLVVLSFLKTHPEKTSPYWRNFVIRTFCSFVGCNVSSPVTGRTAPVGGTSPGRGGLFVLHRNLTWSIQVSVKGVVVRGF